ncbi:GGDEF domain-containing protein [Ruminococcus flavefaciens]|uniref:Diguanylate cyclase (GGDEF) domain-containing protein n=1 Tax=Ruminococcus flavefaciens TaxID=1265 RepID=A0A1K1P0P9_RUMFL|nr:GGDEF domain-containing protein [Ruminococcus flavefaciens]SFW41352.1 diguanylate cyclase (GGDEF) domain-containing protein [Ruminococcus flavefaciens]
MDNFNVNEMTLEKAIDFFKDNVGALVIADSKTNSYKPVVRRGIFNKLVAESGGKYHDLLEKLWYHLSKTSDTVSEKYQSFVMTSGSFSGKYSRKVEVMVEDIAYIVQVSIYPLKEKETYLFILDELDDSQSMEETLTTQKVKTFQNTYLFSMYIDLVKDTIHGISVTELSDDVINQELKYTQWRMMIVNAINSDYRDQFLEWSDPDYLKEKFDPGQTASFDCLMTNLEGIEIWVKLIFSRVGTSNPDDYRYIYMVQNINEEAQELRNTLAQYADRASKDPLTAIYNHGRMETEINNALIDKVAKGEAVSIMIMDIDFFKHVNDNYGHAVGDDTLRHFAALLSDYLNKNNGVVGRWGGEEFVAVCYGADREKAAAIAEDIRQKVAAENFAVVGNITCSIGVTTLNTSDDFERAYRRMDNALYEAKSSGRNCVRLA